MAAALAVAAFPALADVPPPIYTGPTLNLTCDMAGLIASGHIACLADVRRARGAVTYDWTLDDRPLAAKGSRLDLPGVPPGDHVVTVTVTVAGEEALTPSSVSFWRPFPPSLLSRLAPVLGGAAVVVAAALGWLVLRRMRRAA
jgi:hypothetical protein